MNTPKGFYPETISIRLRVALSYPREGTKRWKKWKRILVIERSELFATLSAKMEAAARKDSARYLAETKARKEEDQLIFKGRAAYERGEYDAHDFQQSDQAANT